MRTILASVAGLLALSGQAFAQNDRSVRLSDGVRTPDALRTTPVTGGQAWNTARAVPTATCTTIAEFASSCQAEGIDNATTMDVGGNADNVLLLEEAPGTGVATITGGCIQTLIVDYATIGFPPCTDADPDVLDDVRLRVAYYADGIFGLPDTSQPLFTDDGQPAIFADDTSMFPGSQPFLSRQTVPNGTALGFDGAVEYFYQHAPVTLGAGPNLDVYGVMPSTDPNGVPNSGDEQPGSCFWVEWLEAGDLQSEVSGCRAFLVYAQDVDAYAARADADGSYYPSSAGPNDLTFCIDAEVDRTNLEMYRHCFPPAFEFEPDGCRFVEAFQFPVSQGGYDFRPIDLGLDYPLPTLGFASGTMYAESGDNGARRCGETPGNLYGGIWFTVTGTGNRMRVSMCRGTTLPGADLALAIYCGGCDSLYCVAGADNTFGDCPEVEFCSEPGVEYLIFVHNAADHAGTEVGEIRVEDLSSPCTPDRPSCQPCNLGDLAMTGFDFDGDTVAEIPNIDETLVEPCSDAYVRGNQGCNSDGFSDEFMNLALGDVVVGTVNNDDGPRDHDWFRLVLADQTYISWEARAEVGINLLVIAAPPDGEGGFDCAGVSNVTILAEDHAQRCFQTARIEISLPAGEHILFLGIDPFYNYPCEKDENAYIARLATADCPGDINTTGTNNGVPDGTTDLSDLLYFVNIWNDDQGNTPGSPADVTTTGSAPGGAGFGVPDGVVNLSDLLFFVNAWNEGLGLCP